MTFIGLVLVLYVISQLIVLNGFARQEDAEVAHNIERVRSALDNNLSSLQGTTKDWAAWDDTYTYVVNANDDYYKSNLANDASLTNNRLNLMMFVDASGKLIFSKA